MVLFLASLSLLLKAELHACPMILYENEFYFVGVKSRFSSQRYSLHETKFSS